MRVGGKHVSPLPLNYERARSPALIRTTWITVNWLATALTFLIRSRVLASSRRNVDPFSSSHTIGAPLVSPSTTRRVYVHNIQTRSPKHRAGRSRDSSANGEPFPISYDISSGRFRAIRVTVNRYVASRPWLLLVIPLGYSLFCITFVPFPNFSVHSTYVYIYIYIHIRTRTHTHISTTSYVITVHIRE